MTLFNGQQALVVDTAFQPFVISVIPVVGEFAAAQQPVIVVLSEGTMLTVQAVVSDDRRYVRLTLVPFFSEIGDVDTFTFEGSETTSTTSGSSRTKTTMATTRDDKLPTDYPQRYDGPVADVPGDLGEYDGECARRRYGVAGRYQAAQRRPQRIRRAAVEQGAVRRPTVPQRGYWSRDGQPDDDGHSSHYYSGRGRRTPGHRVALRLPSKDGNYRRFSLPLGALLAALAVGLGAYAAHGLDKLIVARGYEAELQQRLAWFETGVRYHMYHASACC